MIDLARIALDFWVILLLMGTLGMLSSFEPERPDWLFAVLVLPPLGTAAGLAAADIFHVAGRLEFLNSFIG